MPIVGIRLLETIAVKFKSVTPEITDDSTSVKATEIGDGRASGQKKGTLLECLSDGFYELVGGRHFPMQKWEKMESRRSSVTTSPITSPIAAVASRRS